MHREAYFFFPPIWTWHCYSFYNSSYKVAAVFLSLVQIIGKAAAPTERNNCVFNARHARLLTGGTMESRPWVKWVAWQRKSEQRRVHLATRSLREWKMSPLRRHGSAPFVHGCRQKSGKHHPRLTSGAGYGTASPSQAEDLQFWVFGTKEERGEWRKVPFFFFYVCQKDQGCLRLRRGWRV